MTVQEFQIQLQSVPLDKFFPEILPIGQINNQVIISQVHNHSGLCYNGFSSRGTEIFRQFENIGLTILSALSKDKLNLTIIDSQITTNFTSLRKVDNKIGLISWKTIEDFEEIIANLIARTKRITSNFLDEEIKTVHQFNLKNPERPIKYEFIIVPNLHQIKDIVLLQNLLNISKHSALTGLFIICNFDLTKIKPINSYDDEFVPKAKSTLQKLKKYMSVITNYNNEYSFENVHESVSLFLENYTFNFFEFNQNILMPAIVSKHQSLNQGNEYDFIEIPIGFEGHKEVFLKFGDKSNRGGFIAGKQGSGKSSLLRTIILEIIKKYSPNEVKLILFDMKGSAGAFGFLENLEHVELIVKGNNCLITALSTLKDKIEEIEKSRIDIYKQANVTDNLSQFVRKTGKKLPVYLIIYDEGHHLLDKHNTEFNDIQGHIAKELRYIGVYHLFSSQFISTWSSFKDEYRINIDVSICGQLDDDMDKPPKFRKKISTLGLQRMRMAIEDDTVNKDTSVFDLKYIEADELINQAKLLGYWLKEPRATVIEGFDVVNSTDEDDDIFK